MRNALPILLSLALVACSSLPEVEGDPAFELGAGATYAWVEDALDGVEEEAPVGEYLEALENGLQALGARPVDASEADVLLDMDLRIEIERRDLDPVFSLFVAEEHEWGVLRVRFYDPADESLLWGSECRHELRLKRRSFGGLPPLWQELDRRREWLPDREVEKLLAMLGG